MKYFHHQRKSEILLSLQMYKVEWINQLYTGADLGIGRVIALAAKVDLLCFEGGETRG